ncbi:MAG TPA: alpha/beta hydrolase [Pirellulales bacterium]|nr:alpha/beta hydrolase [Pirellulales bacterium]
MMDVDPPLILLPGMADDGRLFRHQRTALSFLCTPDWIEPLDREPLADYAQRFAQAIAPGRRCFVGGASFGGLVALEMAAHLRAEACFLVASVRSDREFPWRLRALRPAATLGPTGLGQVAAWVARSLAPFLPGVVVGRLDRLSNPQSAFLRWASWAALTWQPSANTRGVRVFQIHGSADRTFPVKHTCPDVVVTGAGHLLPFTHPEAVNEFIRRRLIECG